MFFPCVNVQDGHGSVTALLNEDGTERKTYNYNPYGKEEESILYPMGSKTAIMLWRLQVETPHNPFRYCGEYYDDETDLIYLRNRYYDNQTGRFISEDPTRDGLNWYVYANNNSIKFIDPSGLYYLEKDKDGQVYAVIESGDTLSNISYSEVVDANAYLDLNYAEPGYLEVGQRVNITGIYNENYPVPTNIMLSKTGHTQGDSGLRGVPDEEISRRARDRNLSGEERRRYQREEKLRGQRNKQKRQSHYSVQ